ncbi:Probable RNA-directed DNA polymerase from transposon BS [Eumeta japonica]|uniref:Probable RNA-directed DNA polymerase from transposon BS n=1 Tax=Eumeta variegata TaxID=151549 RepID=A0A4C1W0D7_EUMVA|nr:Probable RNA-directed DNA polymerase from transposon BS [Eumeta japonica]
MFAQPAPDLEHVNRVEKKSSVGPRYLPKTIYRRSRQTRSKTHQRVKTQKGTGPGWVRIQAKPLLPQQALRLVEHISEGFKRKTKTVAVFFDVAKAFDKVWHAGLIYKLHQLQVPDRLVFIIQQYLTNRHFSFRHEKSISAKRLITAGVPQGSTLSPLLYSAYTNDIPRPQTGVQLALFADDTAYT